MLKAGQVTGLWCPAGHVLLCNLVIFVARVVRQGACGHSGTRFFEACTHNTLLLRYRYVLYFSYLKDYRYIYICVKILAVT